MRELTPLPLLMITPPPNDRMSTELSRVPARGSITFASGIDNRTLQAAYSCAKSLIFPSLAEGFGWPIIEALSCGCAVITTDEPPMTEVGGPAAHYVPRMKSSEHMDEWAAVAVEELANVLGRDEETCIRESAEGIAWAARFDPVRTIDAYLEVYKKVVQFDSGQEDRSSFG